VTIDDKTGAVSVQVNSTDISDANKTAISNEVAQSVEQLGITSLSN